MDLQTEARRAVTFARIDSDAEEHYFASAPLDEIRHELKHFGVQVEEIVASLQEYLARRIGPHAPRRKESVEDVFLRELPSIERIAAYVARRNEFPPDEAEEFIAEVRVRLIENDYAILRKFQGRSSLSTYLTTVIARLCIDYRTHRWGKWHPSAEAKRLGDVAITLERLMSRDGYSFSEAVSILTIRENATATVAELEAIYLRLPLRPPPPSIDPNEEVLDVAGTDAADDRVRYRDRVRSARSAVAVIDAVIEEMEPVDQLILRLRFWHAMSGADIARMLHLDQRKTYKRLNWLFVLLRRSLENAGIDADVANELISQPVSELGSIISLMQPACDVKRPA